MNKKSSPYDTIYQHKQTKIAAFNFDDKVAAVFENMIHRSVPGYQAIVQLTAGLTVQYMQPQSTCYDLGCSLGDVIYTIREINQSPGHLVGIDNSPAMLEQCKAKLTAQSSTVPYTLLCRDFCQLEMEPASVVILNFTLQFIDTDLRLALIEQIYQNLLPSGVLILSEKIHFSDPQHDQLVQKWHEFFKYTQGYSQLEISQKRQALEKTLLTNSLDEHKDRLHLAGFQKIYLSCQFFNFVSLIAIK